MPRWALAADDGPKIFEDNCSTCHTPKKKPLDKKQMTREKWKEAIDLMIEKDKLDEPLSKPNYATLLDWFATTHGPADPGATAANSNAGDGVKKGD